MKTLEDQLRQIDNDKHKDGVTAYMLLKSDNHRQLCELRIKRHPDTPTMIGLYRRLKL